jgi:hypothetical protein
MDNANPTATKPNTPTVPDAALPYLVPDDGRTPPRPREMPNRDRYTRDSRDFVPAREVQR